MEDSHLGCPGRRASEPVGLKPGSANQQVIGKRKLVLPSASLTMADLVPTTSSRSSLATAIRRAVIR